MKVGGRCEVFAAAAGGWSVARARTTGTGGAGVEEVQFACWGDGLAGGKGGG